MTGVTRSTFSMPPEEAGPSTHIGDQLELGLDDVRPRIQEEPWGGRSPRELTKAWITFSLEARRASGSNRNVSCEGLKFIGELREAQLLLFINGD